MHFDTQYRLWDAALSWLLRVAFVLEANSLCPNVTCIEYFLHFEGFDKWTGQKIEDLPSMPEELTTSVNRSSSTIRIVVPVGFITYFANPKNIAERKLVAAMLNGAVELAGKQALSPQRVEELVQSIVKNDDARFFHVAYAQNYRQYAEDYHEAKPRYVEDGDINFATSDLAWAIRKREAGFAIESKDDCNVFLHSVVDEIWSRLSTKLKTVNRLSLITRCLNNIEAIECDKEQWRMTANALLAAYNDRADVIRSAHEREIRRSRSEIVSRAFLASFFRNRSFGTDSSICGKTPEGR